MLMRFKDEGEAVARAFGKGAISAASTMSQMLRDNFRYIKEKVEVGDTVRHKLYGTGIVQEKFIQAPFGEMLLVTFNGTKRKKVETKDVVRLEQDTITYVDDDVEASPIHDEADTMW